jgi:hypothetical protein
MGKSYKILFGEPKRKYLLEELSVDKKLTLKLKKWLENVY